MISNNEDEVPVIDLAKFPREAADPPPAELIDAVARACSTIGFFQIINHGVPEELVERFRAQCANYFTKLDPAIKDGQRRNETNARGYFDDELTKQRIDWKQALDVGVPGSRDWKLPDDDPLNACLDGLNQMPDEKTELPGFRSTVVEYFEACAELSDRVAKIMAAGILQDGNKTNTNGDGDPSASQGSSIVEDLRRNHTSYLRMNYYPTCPPAKQEDGSLGISPHKDAGFLTVLLQDDDCHSLQVWRNEQWNTVIPIKGAFTINTGDMAQIWSNGLYKAPLHRVLTNASKVRYSAPFFYNPGYDAHIKPVNATNEEPTRYNECLWGYFRAVRFAGDLTDLGVEIQIGDFETDQSPENRHLQRQRVFAEQARFDVAFSVERFRDLLTM